MKRTMVGILSGMLVLTACGQILPTTQTATIEERAATPSPIPTATQTFLPSATPTASITPLPTIPTFTPTFDASTIVTVTPARQAECPKEDNSPTLEALLPSNLNELPPHHEEVINSFQNFLNAGGAISSVINKLQNAKWTYEYEDFTGDKLPEFIFIDPELVPILRVFYCQNKQYELFTLIPTHEVEMDIKFTHFEAVTDLNSNNLPEFIWMAGGCSNSGCFKVFTLEWNGYGFTDLSPTVEMFGVQSIDIRDIDRNGTKEIILRGDQPGTGNYKYLLPWRFKTSIYTWDGQEYALASENFDPPQYRFQAVQDADRYTLEKNYTKAFQAYQNAIFDETLDWWSPEKRIYYFDHYFDPGATTTPDPTLNPDLAEYPRLAAYAYYRILLLHLMQEQESDADTIYKTLQDKFGDDPYGQPYVEMTTAFWDAYQATNKMYDGCAAAIQYAVEHPEILIPLGSDYHGSQSHTYVPANVCPFR